MTLDLKRKLLVDEAYRIKEINDMLGEKKESLVKGIVSREDESNWDIAFIKYCIEQTEKICDNLSVEHIHSDFKWKDKTLEMWMEMDRRYRKQRPNVGDIIIMHYMKQGTLLTSGQVGIVTNVNRNLTVNTIEGTNISQFEDIPIQRQSMGVEEKLRSSKGNSKMRVLGFFSPWLDR